MQEEIRLLRNGKNSGTKAYSSSSLNRWANAKSLREKTERKTGGQPGYGGTTLMIKEVPDKTINYVAQYCNGCVEDLQQAASVLEEGNIFQNGANVLFDYTQL